MKKKKLRRRKKTDKPEPTTQEQLPTTEQFKLRSRITKGEVKSLLPLMRKILNR